MSNEYATFDITDECTDCPVEKCCTTVIDSYGCQCCDDVFIAIACYMNQDKD